MAFVLCLLPFWGRIAGAMLRADRRGDLDGDSGAGEAGWMWPISSSSQTRRRPRGREEALGSPSNAGCIVSMRNKRRHVRLGTGSQRWLDAPVVLLRIEVLYSVFHLIAYRDGADRVMCTLEQYRPDTRTYNTDLYDL